MNFRSIWQRITESRHTRDLEISSQRESALREEFARRTHALEAQIAQAYAENCRLRAENRALLNSVLGIAGIPPVIVAEPPSAAGKPDSAFVGAQHAVPGAAPPRGDDEQDHAAEALAANGSASPSTIAGRSSAAPLQKQSRRTRAQKDPHVIAPVRRRSWHQIYRMLEFESSRRKEREP